MRRSPFSSLLAILLTAALGFYAGKSWSARQTAAGPGPSGPASPAQTPVQARNSERGAIPPAPQPQLQDQEKATISLFQHASPAVVFITSLARQQDFFSLNVSEIPQGAGSGFVWDREGHVVTNFHVVQNADALKVTLSDQSVWDARLVGAAPEKDLAVLKIDAPAAKLTPLPLGSSENLQVGQSVFAIGNPFGFDQSLTT